MKCVRIDSTPEALANRPQPPYHWRRVFETDGVRHYGRAQETLSVHQSEKRTQHSQRCEDEEEAQQIEQPPARIILVIGTSPEL